MNEELFIELGFLDHVRYFIHTQYKEKLSEEEMSEMCAQSYNSLIHNKILEKDEKICIFNIMKTGKVIVVVVNHKSFSERKFNKKELEEIFPKIFDDNKSERIIIKTTGEVYYVCKVDMKLEEKLTHLKNMKFEIYKIISYQSLKEITYFN